MPTDDSSDRNTHYRGEKGSEMVEIVPHHTSAEEPYLSQSEWSQASTLAERQATLRAKSTENGQQWPYDRALAERRHQKWLQQTPFEQENYFAAHLKQDNLTEEDFLVLLGETPEDLQARLSEKPAWLQILFDTFSTAFSPDELPGYVQPSGGFLPALAPFLKRGYARLCAHLQALASTTTARPFDTNTVGMLFLPHLAGRLAQLSTKALTLELNIARMEGRLAGETTVERFQAFARELTDSAKMLDFLRLYPVLARKLITVTDFWETSSLEILTRLYHDWPEICTTFSPESEPGPLTAVEVGIGDTHRQGHSVVKVTFASGFCLIYKPKSLHIDRQFAQLLQQLHEWDTHLLLRVARVIDHDTYGWAEYITAQECNTPEEVERFYQRLGSLLTLLYVLDATDMHIENVIASGEHPILIDLETLLHPDMPLDKSSLSSPGARLLQTSVMSSGLLPREVWRQGKSDGIDISGLGGRGGQLIPSPVALFKEIGTDQMRLVREHIEVTEHQNRPRLAGNAVDFAAYFEQFQQGFVDMYHLLLAHRQELLEQQLPLFAHTKIRFLARPTLQYAHLLSEGTHPTLLLNALDQERFYDRLWALVPHLSAMERLIHAEQSDLHVGDIPMFWTYTDSRDLYTSQDECIPDFFQASSLANVQHKIGQLSEQDLAQQTWIIQASVLMTHLEPGQITWKGTQLRADAPVIENAELIHAACEIGDRLCAQAICSNEAVSWLTTRLIGEHSWSIAPVDVDIYNGLAGICLFLAYLGKVSAQDRYTLLARQIIQTIRQKIEQVPAEKRRANIGLFDGWSGLLYLYAHLATLWQDPAILLEAQEMLTYFVDAIEKDEALDVISGSAGCLLGLLAFYQISPSLEVLQAAIRCGEHLLNKATPLPCGQGWLSPMSEDGTKALAGFSHGTAGIALSLFRLAAASGEQRFHAAALAGLEYERSLYSPRLRNWPDLREIARTDHGPSSMLSWCHGAPGIGMARLASLPYNDDPKMREEIALAIEITLEQGFGTNHSLCHGDLGNVELLLSAAQHFPDEKRYQEEVRRLAGQELSSIRHLGWCTGVPHSFEVPGLMSGIAGIGYGLLRLADPEHIPSILVLDPPFLTTARKDQ